MIPRISLLWPWQRALLGRSAWLLLGVFVATRIVGAGDSPDLTMPTKPSTGQAEGRRLAARVSSVRKAAEGIQVDGRAGDWAGIPTVVDDGPRLERSALDLREVGVAPLAGELRVMVRTAKPVTEGSVWVSLDLHGGEAFDCAIDLTGGARSDVEVYTLGKVTKSSCEGVESARGEILEARIPWTVLEKILPSMGKREWIRARFLTWDGSERVDRGLSVASYRLTEALKFENPITEVTVEPPAKTTLYVAQGALSEFSHAKIHAYDFDQRDLAHRSYEGEGDFVEHPVSDFHVYGETVLSPVKGQVVTCQTGHADEPPGKAKERASNYLVIETAEGGRLILTHLAADSIQVAEGDRVVVGQVLAKIGNSGFTDSPHLHLEIDRRGKSVPVALRNVRVKLNSGRCYWERNLEVWEPREGFFFRPAVGTASAEARVGG